MGIFDRISSTVIGVAKDATTGAVSYLETLQKQAEEREKDKQKEAEKENEVLQELEKQKQKIFDEIESERKKLEEEREMLAKERSDPSFTSTVMANAYNQDSEESIEDADDGDGDDDKWSGEEWSDWDEESEEKDNEESEELSDDQKGDLYPGTGDENSDLLEQLADMTAQQNELVRRLNEAGMVKEVQDIVGSSEATNVLYAVDSDDLGAISFSARSVTRQFRAALELMMKAMYASEDQREQLMADAQAAIKGAEQAAGDVEQLANEMEKKADDIQGLAAKPLSIAEAVKYDWKRKPMFISYGDPSNVFQKLDSIWNDISFGSKRDKSGSPLEFPKFSPYATARGASVSTGFLVPEYAYKTEQAFINWCESVGLGEGVSLEVTSLMAKPGYRSQV